MRALVGARTARRRAGEHALARAVVDERTAAAVLAAAQQRRDAAAAAVTHARTSIGTSPTTALELARTDAYAARLRRRLAAAEDAFAEARAMVAAAARATAAQQRDLTARHADQKVAERALDRADADARRVRDLRED